MLLGLVLPLILQRGLPHLTDGPFRVLVDSGASSTILRRAVMQSGGMVASIAGASGVTPIELESTQLALPDDCAGIIGWDFLRAAVSCAGGVDRSVQWDLDSGELRINEPRFGAARAFCEIQEITFAYAGSRTALYPTMACSCFGGGAVSGACAILDSGSPVSIANAALADAARLDLDADDDETSSSSSPKLTTTGVDGSSTPLRAAPCAGLRLGDAASGLVDLSRPTLRVADLPAFAALGRAQEPTLLLGLDLLGSNFCVVFDAPQHTNRAILELR